LNYKTPQPTLSSHTPKPLSYLSNCRESLFIPSIRQVHVPATSTHNCRYTHL